MLRRRPGRPPRRWLKRSVGPVSVISSAGAPRRVADQPVGEPEARVVHRARRRHADRPSAQAARVSPAPSSACRRRAPRRWRGRRRTPSSRLRVHVAGDERRVGHQRRAGSRGWSRCRASSVSASAAAMRSQRLGARRRRRRSIFASSGIVVGRDLQPGLDPAVAARDRRAGSVTSVSAPGAGPEVARRILGVDARPRWPRPAPAAPARAASSSPAAWRTIHSTRSTPVTSSVTPCSTWRRVFTSRK